ncbi:MAG: gliding motility protein GldL [Candidatus Symbiothrix sp.]|jgi:gliding motility-associated protein GldL|nr:gliding motility protein GldL [Candidatus Symbiothrix sp.]
MGFRRRYKNIIEKFLSGDQGKRFFQVFYSLGAAIIIIGVLAKLMHWPYGLGNILLYVGFVTEAIVFTISAFDHPTKDWQWDRIFPSLETEDEMENQPLLGVNRASAGSSSILIDGKGTGVNMTGAGAGTGTGAGANAGGGGGTVIIGGGGFGGFSGGGTSGTQAPTSAKEAVEAMSSGEIRQSFGIPNAVGISEEDSNALTASIKKMAAAADQLSKMAEMTDATQQYLDQLTDMSENMQKFSSVTNSLTGVSDILLNAYKSITDNSDGINQSSRGYVHQMESLNRNIQGLNTIYEIQLKSVSSQIDAIERINAGLMRIKDLYEGSIVDSSVFRSETEKMAQQLHALNSVYNRLLNAMTMNMYGAGGNPNFTQNPYNPGI